MEFIAQSTKMFALKTAADIAADVTQNVVSTRKQRKLTQAQLAEQSGVSLGSLRRFEQTGEISFKSLVQLLIVLGEGDAFEKGLNNKTEAFSSIQDVLRRQAESKKR